MQLLPQICFPAIISPFFGNAINAIAVFADFLFRFNAKFVLHRRVTFSINKNFVSKFKYRYYKIAKIIAVSEAVKEELINSGIKANLIDVVYSGIDLRRFKTKKKFNLKFL